MTTLLQAVDQSNKRPFWQALQACNKPCSNQLPTARSLLRAPYLACSSCRAGVVCLCRSRIRTASLAMPCLTLKQPTKSTPVDCGDKSANGYCRVEQLVLPVVALSVQLKKWLYGHSTVCATATNASRVVQARYRGRAAEAISLTHKRRTEGKIRCAQNLQVSIHHSSICHSTYLCQPDAKCICCLSHHKLCHTVIRVKFCRAACNNSNSVYA